MKNITSIKDLKYYIYKYYYEPHNTIYIITIIEHPDGYAEAWTHHRDYGQSNHVVGIMKQQCPKDKKYIDVLINAAIEYIETEA